MTINFVLASSWFRNSQSCHSIQCLNFTLSYNLSYHLIQQWQVNQKKENHFNTIIITPTCMPWFARQGYTSEQKELVFPSNLTHYRLPATGWFPGRCPLVYLLDAGLGFHVGFGRVPSNVRMPHGKGSITIAQQSTKAQASGTSATSFLCVRSWTWLRISTKVKQCMQCPTPTAFTK